MARSALIVMPAADATAWSSPCARAALAACRSHVVVAASILMSRSRVARSTASRARAARFSSMAKAASSTPPSGGQIRTVRRTAAPAAQRCGRSPTDARAAASLGCSVVRCPTLVRHGATSPVSARKHPRCSNCAGRLATSRGRPRGVGRPMRREGRLAGRRSLASPQFTVPAKRLLHLRWPTSGKKPRRRR